jgi:5-methylcytosine-specific restriction endonuclease McrA
MRLTISEATHAKLRRAADLLGHTVPGGDLAEVLDRALTLLVDHLERTKYAARRPEGKAEPSAPDPPPRKQATTARRARSPRYIPAAVRREVWERDSGRCSYVGPAGRCGQTRRLEFHHRQPFAEGGPPTAQNLTLNCVAHNRLEAARWFGEDFDQSKSRQPERTQETRDG